MYSFGLPAISDWNTVYPYRNSKEDRMSISSTATHPAPSPYEIVGRRIQRLVADPKVQKIQLVTVTRRDDESVEAWERVLAELDATDGVIVERAEDGSASIGWKQFIDG